MRFGYIAITLLPPLGIHLVSIATGRVWQKYVGYVLALVFIAIFLGNSESVNAAVCGEIM